jgi:prepilin-type processing-associated H-X9-DG protein/prepilin-type N-terminal cleavage/methylation domain-containing protein
VDRLMRRALTLVEILVCLGIVAVLTSLAASGISTVVSSSRSASCSSNLRQLGTAAHAYMVSNRDALPAAILFEVDGGTMRQVMWDHVRTAAGGVEPGPLWSALDSPFRVMRCPCCMPSAMQPHDSGYNYNTSYLATEGHYPVTGGDGLVRSGWDAARPGLAPGSRRRHADTALFGEGGWAGGTNRFMRAPSATVEGDLPTVYAGAQAFRHLGSTNVCWLDGHVSPVVVAHAGLHATAALAQGTLGFPAHGFLSEDDSAYDPR